MRKLQSAALLVALTATLGLSACGGSDEGASLDDSSAQQVGGALAAEVGGMPAEFTASDLSNGSIGDGFFGARAMSVARWASPSVRGFTPPAPCPSVDDLTDADGDGVPDDATFTFIQADCTNGAFYVSGTIHLVDPSPTAVGYSGTFANFLVHEVGQGSDFAQIKLNGTHGVLGTPTTVTLAENITTRVDAEGNGQTLQGSLANNWSIQFDAGQGQTIVMDDVLPDGDLSIQGNFVYDVNGRRFAMTVRTQTPLTYDSSCAGQVHPFTGGELRAHLGGPNGQVYVQVTYTACGVEPTVVLVGRNS